jgi:hypothetical protein
MATKERKTGYNNTYPKVAVQWLNQALCFYQSFCLVVSEVIRNRHLRVAAKRYHALIDQQKRSVFL